VYGNVYINELGRNRSYFLIVIEEVACYHLYNASEQAWKSLVRLVISNLLAAFARFSSSCVLIQSSDATLSLSLSLSPLLPSSLPSPSLFYLLLPYPNLTFSLPSRFSLQFPLLHFYSVAFFLKAFVCWGFLFFFLSSCTFKKNIVYWISSIKKIGFIYSLWIYLALHLYLSLFLHRWRTIRSFFERDRERISFASDTCKVSFQINTKNRRELISIVVCVL